MIEAFSPSIYKGRQEDYNFQTSLEYNESLKTKQTQGRIWWLARFTSQERPLVGIVWQDLQVKSSAPSCGNESSDSPHPFIPYCDEKTALFPFLHSHKQTMIFFPPLSFSILHQFLRRIHLRFGPQIGRLIIGHLI